MPVLIVSFFIFDHLYPELPIQQRAFFQIAPLVSSRPALRGLKDN
jgi:hypothetical protein